MKKFRFKVKKTIENTIEIRAESYREALVKLFELFIIADKDIFEKSDKKDVSYDIFFDSLANQKDLEMIKNMKQILQNLEQNEDEFGEKNAIKIDENDNDFDTKITKIVCKKCKKGIPEE